MDLILPIVILTIIISIITIIVVVVNQAALDKNNEHIVDRSLDHKFKPNQFKNVIVNRVGISKSVTSLFKMKSNILCHEDLYCVDVNNRCYNISEIYSDHQFNSDGILAPKQRGVEIILVKPVTTNSISRFKIYNYDYQVDTRELINIKPTSLETIYDLVKIEYHTPYNLLFNNCHDTVDHVINSLLDKSNNKIEMKLNQPLKYLREIVIDKFNSD